MCSDDDIFLIVIMKSENRGHLSQTQYRRYLIETSVISKALETTEEIVCKMSKHFQPEFSCFIETGNEKGVCVRSCACCVSRVQYLSLICTSGFIVFLLDVINLVQLAYVYLERLL